MKKTTLVLAALLVGLTVATPNDAQAQVAIGPYGGYNLDAEELYFGTNVRIPLPAAIGNSFLMANPGFDYYPFIGVDGVDASASLYAVNLDVIYPFVLNSAAATPYVGAGLLIQRASVEVLGVSDSNTDVGLNLRGGAMFGTGPVQPFGEGVLVIADETGLLLKGGVFITIGR